MKILVADDDTELRDLLAFALRQAGYLVIPAADGAEALRAFDDEQPDLLILDVNMPRLDGLEVLRRVREQGPTPVLLLTVLAGEADEVRGLDLGADDYMTKPFSPRTLLARVRALLRRAEPERPAPQSVGDVRLDVEDQSISIGGGAPLRLTNLELRLMQYLAANAGHAVTTERLLLHVWGYRGVGDRQLLKQLVHRLRGKLEHDPSEPRYVVTVPGVGYMLKP